MALRTVGVKLTADVSNYVSGLTRAKASTVDFAGQLNTAAKKGNLDAVADQATKVGLGLAGMAAYAIKAAADFDQSMSAVSAATHASAGDMASLRAAALEAGKDTMYSATQAADAITELSKAGISTADILKGGLTGALNLAAAGQLDVGDAAEIAASAMTDFKLSGAQLPHVADLLAAGAGKAQGSVQDLGYALDQGGLVAAQFGLSIEDTTGVLAEFAAAGMTGSDAGTSLKTMLLAMANPTTQTQALMDKLGVSFYDTTGKFIGMSGVAAELQKQLGGLTAAQRQEALGQIFGNDAIRAASILYTDGATGVAKWKSAVNDAGYAAETAQKQTNNLAGDIERLKGSIDTLAIESGSGANSGLRLLTKGLNDVVNQFANFPPAIGSGITMLAALGGAGALGLAGFVKLRKGVASAAEELAAMGPTGEVVGERLTQLSGIAAKAAVAFVALEVVDLVAGHFVKAAPDVDKLTNSIAKFADTGKTSGELSKDFGANLNDLSKDANVAAAASHGFWGALNDIVSTIPGIGKLSDALDEHILGVSFNEAKGNMTALDTALTDYMTTTNDANKAQAVLGQVLKESGLDAQQLAAQLPSAYNEVGLLTAQMEKSKNAYATASDGAKKTATAMDGQAAAAGIATDANGNYKTVADAAAAAALGEAGALSQLSKMLKEQADPVFALVQGEADLKKAHDDASAAVKKYGQNSTQARDATNKLADAALGLQGDVGALGANFDGKLSPSLLRSLHAAGLTDGQIKILTKEFQSVKKSADAYQGNYNANVTLTGAAAVSAKLKALQIQQYALNQGLTPSAAAAAYQKDSDRNKQRAYAGGGWTGSGDTYEPAGIVHADEYVIKKSSRRKIEAVAPGLLDAMNETGQVPGYAAGGRAWPFRTTAAHAKIPTLQQVQDAVFGGKGGTNAGSGQLAAWIRAGIADTGVPANWASPLHTLIMRESGGNPRAINLTDSNAKAGDPSRGLMQTIGITFEHYRLDSLPDNIYNPVSNIAAGIEYIKSRYGTIFNVQQANPNLPPKGYAAGGHVAMAHGGTIAEPIFGVGASGRTYSFGENYMPERVTPNWQRGGSSGGGGTTVVLQFSGPVGSQQQLESWLTAAFDNLKRKGKVR